MFIFILVGSFLVSMAITTLQGTFYVNVIIVFMVCLVLWLYLDNLSILEDVKKRSELRDLLRNEYHTLNILRLERQEMYRDLRKLELLKYKEIRRNAMIHSSSCSF